MSATQNQQFYNANTSNFLPIQENELSFSEKIVAFRYEHPSAFKII